MGSKRKKPFEQFNPDDCSQLPHPSSSPTSYDILASGTGSNPLDLRKWARIRRLTPNCKVYEHISDYVSNSCTGYNINVLTIYKIGRRGEREPFGDEYRIMLWHGTKPNVIPCIIQTGFRMGTGGWFGGGIYFADRIAMSAGYVTKAASGTAFFILAEVAPGRVYKAHHIHPNYSSAPPGFDSVKGMAAQISDWKENKSYLGAVLPCGATVTSTRHAQYDLPWNEYIMYDPNQIIVRFVVECTM